MKESLVKYHDYLKYELNYSENTIKEYFLHLEKYLHYLKEHNLKIESVKKDDILGYLKYLDSQKLTNKTIANILSSLRRYYDFLLGEGLIKANIFKVIKNPKLEKKLPNFLSYEQMREILDSLEEEKFLEQRDKVIIEVLYATGMRVSELVNLQVKDIDFTKRSIRVFGKGRKERIVYFGTPAQRIIEKYLRERPFTSEYLVLNSKGGKITPRGIQLIIEKIASKASVQSNVTPHTFRHTFATHLLNGGADIKSVGELLGHNSLNTTEIYTHITSDYLKSEYLKNMPRK